MRLHLLTFLFSASYAIIYKLPCVGRFEISIAQTDCYRASQNDERQKWGANHKWVDKTQNSNKHTHTPKNNDRVKNNTSKIRTNRLFVLVPKTSINLFVYATE